MEALATHLKRRNQKYLDEELALPKIPQVPNNQFVKTSVRIHRVKPTVKYVSETTFSPQEEHMHDQVRLLLQPKQQTQITENSRIAELLKGLEPIKEKTRLPKLKQSNGSTSKRKTPQKKAAKHSTPRRKSKSVNNTKLNLNSIFQDQNEFIKNYFAQINDRIKG